MDGTTTMDGTIIPTYPMTGMNNGLLGGDGIGALLIGALLFGGGLWGGNRNGMGNVGAAAVDPYIGLSQQIQSLSGQVNANSITDQLGDLGSNINAFQLASLNANATTNQAICSGFGATNTNMSNGFASVNNSICQGVHVLENTINSNSFNLLNAVNNGFSTSALAACQNTNTLVLQNQQNTNNIISAINDLSSKMDSQLITGLQAEKASLEAQLLASGNTHSLSDEIRNTQAQLAACCCNTASSLNNGFTVNNMTHADVFTKLNDIIALLSKK